MLIKRVNQQHIFASFERPCVTTILGSRRIGKSTLVEEYVKLNYNNTWVSLNMDVLATVQNVAKGNLKQIIEEQSERQIGTNKKIWVTIDEAQKCPEIFDQIKTLYDQYKDKNAIKFILTGSSFLTLHKLGAETLAGRIELLYLREFCLQELFSLINQQEIPKKYLLDFIDDSIDIDSLENYIASRAPLRQKINAALNENLIFGGLPETIKEISSDLRFIYLSNYLQTYLEKDIRAIGNISDFNLYQRLMEVIAEQTGSLRQDEKVLASLGCSRDTLKKYRGILLATLMYDEIFPYIGSSLKRLMKSPKCYLLNNGLISYLTGLNDLVVLQKTGLIGHRFENWFLKELEVWLDRCVQRNKIYYWRTSAGVEVDFVVEKKPQVFPFEVTYSDQVDNKKIKNLRTFLHDEPKAKIGFCVYNGDFYYDKKNRICFLPAWAFG